MLLKICVSKNITSMFIYYQLVYFTIKIYYDVNSAEENDEKQLNKAPDKSAYLKTMFFISHTKHIL